MFQKRYKSATQCKYTKTQQGIQMIRQLANTNNKQATNIAQSTSPNNITKHNFISSSVSQKILASVLFALLATLNLANAEVSGVFAGLQVG